MKRLTSLLLVLGMLISTVSFPMSVKAEEENPSTVTAIGKPDNSFNDVPFANGYNAFCLDSLLKGPTPGREYTISDTSAAMSNFDGSDISQKLKLLFTQCFEEIFTKTDQGYVILDENVSAYFNPSSTVQSVIYHYAEPDRFSYPGNGTGARWANVVNTYNGPAIPDAGYQKTLENGDVVTFYFMVFLSGQSENQDMFAYKIDVTSAEDVKPETTEATIQKVWDDEDDQDGKRPDSLTVTLSNGTEVTLNEGNGWKATVTDLPKYDDGEEIAYTWTEEDMPEGYELADTRVEGTVTILTNSYIPEIPESSKESNPDTSEKSEPENSSTPDTGDYSNIGMLFTSFVTAWIVIFAVIIYRRKQQR